jgi:hypothetical protein
MEFHDHGYTLTPTGCTTQSCVDVGTYSISSDGGTLTLESSITGAERAIAIAIVETRAADASGAGLLGPRAEPVVKPGQTLTNPGTKIISAEEIVRALLPKQRQQLVTDPAPRSVPPDR